MRRRLGFVTTILLAATAVVVAPGTRAIDAPSCVAYASAIVTGGDGNLWIAEDRDHEVGRVPPGGGPIDEFPLSITSSAHIALGPDGNVWVLSSFRTLARVTPTGTIVTFDLPVPDLHNNSRATGLASGPDGNIWALRSMNGDDRLTRVTPSGAVTDFQIDVQNPSDLVSADGFLWFLDHPSSGARLFRADTAANIAERTTFARSVQDLVAGPDGALWTIAPAAASQPDALVRVPTDGSDTTEFTLPPVTGLSAPRSLTSGPDGRLWLIDDWNHTLVALTTTGVGSTYPQPAGIRMIAITTGPDGNLWFGGEDDVGSVNTSGALVSSRAIPISTGSAIACSTTPDFGRVTGGETITLRGRGLDNVTDVWFDGSRAPSFSVASDREMTVVTPAHPRGTSMIALDTIAGRQSFNTQFRFAVPPVASSVCPSLGPTSGGYWVTISGNDMDLATHVWFGTTLTTTVQRLYDEHGFQVHGKLAARVPAVSKGGGVKLRAAGPAGSGPQGATFVYQKNLPGPVGSCNPLGTVDPGLPDA